MSRTGYVIRSHNNITRSCSYHHFLFRCSRALVVLLLLLAGSVIESFATVSTQSSIMLIRNFCFCQYVISPQYNKKRAFVAQHFLRSALQRNKSQRCLFHLGEKRQTNNNNDDMNLLVQNKDAALSSFNGNHVEQLFRMELPEGFCVGISFKDESSSSICNQHTATTTAVTSETHYNWLNNYLHPDEIAFGYQLKEGTQRNTFFLGRLAIRHALALLRPTWKQQSLVSSPSSSTILDSTNALDPDAAILPQTSSVSILKDKHGRPDIPKGFLGSISHKKNIGVALVSVDNNFNIGATSSKNSATPKLRGIGVDIEKCKPRSSRISRRVLTPSEIESLGNLQNVTKDEEVLLRFSLKESIYKAMHPLICQNVGFQEVEVTPNSNGTANVKYMLQSNAHLNFEETSVHWQRITVASVGEDFFLTSARVVLLSATSPGYLA